MCPLVKTEIRKNVPAITAHEFEGQGITVTFTDEGKDIQAPQGLMFLYVVTVAGKERGLWIKPDSSRAITLSTFVPLLGRTLKISKNGVGNATRYLAEEVQPTPAKSKTSKTYVDYT